MKKNEYKLINYKWQKHAITFTKYYAIKLKIFFKNDIHPLIYSKIFFFSVALRLKKR